MDGDNVVNIPPRESLCLFCRVRVATKLCDMPKGMSRYVGHPPKINGKITDLPMEKVDTCDRQICDKCATEISPGVDFCPKCVKELRGKLGGKK